MSQVATPGQLSMSWCGGQAVFLTRCPSAFFSYQEQPLGRSSFLGLASFSATRALNSVVSRKLCSTSPLLVPHALIRNSPQFSHGMFSDCQEHLFWNPQRLQGFFRRSSHSRSCFVSGILSSNRHPFPHRLRLIASVAFPGLPSRQDALHPSGTGPHEAVDAPAAGRLRLAGAAVVVVCVGHIVCFGCSSGRGRHATTTPQEGRFACVTWMSSKDVCCSKNGL